MSFIYKLLFASLLLSQNNFLYADDCKESKMAVVDLMKIEENALVVKDMIKKMQTQEVKLRTKLEEQRKSLEVKYKDIESKKSVLSREALESQAKDLERDFIDLQKDEKIYSQTLEMVKMQILQDIQKDIKSSVQHIANENDYQIVLSTVALLYADQKKISDITPEVLDSLNGKIKTVDFDNVYNKTYKNVFEQFEKVSKSSSKNKKK